MTSYEKLVADRDALHKALESVLAKGTRLERENATLKADNAKLCKALDGVITKAESTGDKTLGDAIEKALANPTNARQNEAVSKAAFGGR